MRAARARALSSRTSSYAGSGVECCADAPPQSVAYPPGSMIVILMPNLAEPSHLEGERLAQAFERPFRRVIHADVRKGGDATDRRHLQDVSTALRAKDRKRSLGHPQGPEEVGLDLRPRLFLAELLHHAELAVAGVVDDDVEAAEPLTRMTHSGENGVTVGDVERDGQDAVAVFREEVVELGDVASGGRDLVTAVEGCDRPFAAEAARGASDEPGLRSHEKSNPEDIGSIPRSAWRHRTVQDEAAAEPCRKRLGRRLALDLIDGCTWVQEGGISVLDVVVGIAHVAADLELDVGVDRAQVSFL